MSWNRCLLILLLVLVLVSSAACTPKPTDEEAAAAEAERLAKIEEMQKRQQERLESSRVGVGDLSGKPAGEETSRVGISEDTVTDDEDKSGIDHSAALEKYNRLRYEKVDLGVLEDIQREIGMVEIDDKVVVSFGGTIEPFSKLYAIHLPNRSGLNDEMRKTQESADRTIEVGKARNNLKFSHSDDYNITLSVNLYNETDSSILLGSGTVYSIYQQSYPDGYSVSSKYPIFFKNIQVGVTDFDDAVLVLDTHKYLVRQATHANTKSNEYVYTVFNNDLPILNLVITGGLGNKVTSVRVISKPLHVIYADDPEMMKDLYFSRLDFTEQEVKDGEELKPFDFDVKDEETDDAAETSEADGGEVKPEEEIEIEYSSEEESEEHSEGDNELIS